MTFAIELSILNVILTMIVLCSLSQQVVIFFQKCLIADSGTQGITQNVLMLSFDRVSNGL